MTHEDSGAVANPVNGSLRLPVVDGDPNWMIPYRQLAVPVCVIEDLSGRALAFNPAAREFLGIAAQAESLAIKTIYKCLSPDDLEFGLTELRAGRTASADLMLRGGDGRWSWQRLQARALESPRAGAPFGLVLTFTPLATVAVRRPAAPASDALADVVANVPEIGTFHVANPGAGRIEWSDGMVRLLGYLPGEDRPRFSQLLQHIHHEDAERVRAHFDSLLTGQEQSFSTEFRMMSVQGEAVWVDAHVRGTPQLDSAIALTGLLIDTQIKHASRLRANAAVRELESFTYSISHDLRAPVRHIESFVNLLVDAAGDHLTPEELNLTNYLQESVRKLAAMIQGLVEYSRLPKVSTSPEWFPLRQIVERAAESVQIPSNVTLRIGDLPEVKGHPALLEQLFARLFDNAVKFMGDRAEGLVEVLAKAGPGPEFEILVRDNGAGFDQRHADKLFHIFQRLHTPEEFTGIGIGLAIVKRIVDLHGGSIEATGAPNSGATFALHFPYTRSLNAPTA